MSRLPAINSIRYLRNTNQKNQFTSGFIGFGNPVLAQTTAPLRGLKAIEFDGKNYTLSHKIRRLPSLPNTEKEILLLLILWVSFSAISAPDALIKSTNKSVDKSISQELENFKKINISIINNSQNDVNDRLELLYNNIINASKSLGDSELLKLIQSVEYFLLETPNSLKGLLAFVDIWEALISMDTEYHGPDDRSAIYEAPVFPLKTISPGDYTNKIFKPCCLIKIGYYTYTQL